MSAATGKGRDGGERGRERDLGVLVYGGIEIEE